MRSGFSPDTIRASLKARDLIHVRAKDGRFVIGLTTDLTEAQEAPPEQRCLARELIYRSTDTHAAQQVRSEVESYFLRHFPGRCFAWTQSSSSTADEMFIYVALFAPSA